MKFDSTINLGHILTMVSILIVFGAGYTRILSRIDRIEANLDIVFGWFNTHIIGGGNEEWQQRQRRRARKHEDADHEIQGEG